MEMLDYALRYSREHDWPVFPVKSKGKTPMVAGGFHQATTNENVITRWWDQWPDANIGVPTGDPINLFVLDIDGERGEDSFTKLMTEMGDELPETLEARTGSGGRHLFFRMPEGVREIRNKQSFRPGLDIRGTGGYVVVAPSIHESGGRYGWPYDWRDPVYVPMRLLDIIAPKQRTIPPWERKAVARPSTAKKPGGDLSAPSNDSIVIERASRYLQECETAIQGGGGHDALLWAARAMVVGFDLSDADALMLLWNEFNPRCVPPWNQTKPSERKDFERKVQEARRTPGQKPRGWLLDEYGLRSGYDALAEIGKQSAGNLLDSAVSRPVEVGEYENTDVAKLSTANPFPIDLLPPKIIEFAKSVAGAHVVDESFVGLPLIVMAGAAMGNTWRLELKTRFLVCPTLWAGIVAPSGANKSGPMKELAIPLQDNISPDDVEDSLLNPQHQVVFQDATREALVEKLSKSPRGILTYRDELAAWIKSMNSYKKNGDDEQAWIAFWNADRYHLTRKTDDENKTIPAAAISIIGGIQPRIMAEAFTQGNFHSGLVPRVIVCAPPVKQIYWTDLVITDEQAKVWRDAIHWLRKCPFAEFDTETTTWLPHILKLEGKARDVYIDFYNEIGILEHQAVSETERAFISKARIQAGRFILIHHGLYQATEFSQIAAGALPIEEKSAKVGVAMAKWALREQLNLYGYANELNRDTRANEIPKWLRERYPDNETFTPRDIRRLSSSEFPSRDVALNAAKSLIESSVAVWVDEHKQKFRLVV